MQQRRQISVGCRTLHMRCHDEIN